MLTRTLHGLIDDPWDEVFEVLRSYESDIDYVEDGDLTEIEQRVADLCLANGLTEDHARELLDSDAEPTHRQALRDRILAAGLTRMLPKTYQGLTDDPWVEVFEKLAEGRQALEEAEAAAQDQKEREEEAREAEEEEKAADTKTTPEPEVERLHRTLRHLSAELRAEVSEEINPAHPPIANRIDCILNPQAVHSTASLAPWIAERHVPYTDLGHYLTPLPNGVEWCFKCGAVLRHGIAHRWYIPGVGEWTDQKPPTCPDPNRTPQIEATAPAENQVTPT